MITATPTLRRIPLPIFRRAVVGDDIDNSEVVIVEKYTNNDNDECPRSSSSIRSKITSIQFSSNGQNDVVILAHDNIISAFHPHNSSNSNDVGNDNDDDDDDNGYHHKVAGRIPKLKWQTLSFSTNIQTLLSTPVVVARTRTTVAAVNDYINDDNKQQQQQQAAQLVACLTMNNEVHLLRASDGNILHLDH